MQPRHPRVTGVALAAFSLLAIGFTCVAGAAEPGRSLVPLKDFVRHDEFRSVKLSPSGKYLAVTMPIDGRNALGVIELKDRKVTARAYFDRPFEIANFWWAGSNRVVATVAMGVGPLAQPGLTNQLWVMNADGRGQYAINVNGYAYVIDSLRQGPDVVLAMWMPMYRYDKHDLRDVKILRLDLATGSKLVGGVTLPGYAPNDVVVDREGRVRFATGEDDDRNPTLYVRREGDGSPQWRKVAPKGAASLSADLHFITADGKSVYLTSDEGGQRECLRQYHFAGGIFEDVRCREHGAVGQPVVSLDHEALLGIVHEDGLPEFEPLNAEHQDAKLLRSLGKAFEGQRVQVTSGTRDGQRFVILVDSDRNPGDFYLVDRQPLKADYLLSRRAWIDPKAMSPSVAMKYVTRDGATVHGFLTARDGLATRKAPLVVIPHGGPHGIRESWRWDAWAQALANRGYVVLQVNFRGSGGYGMAHELAGYRKWGTVMQDDLTDAVRWAIAQGIVDPDRVCLMGASYGGYSALMSAVREPDLYRCAIGFAGTYDLIEWASDTDISNTKAGRLYLDKALGDRTTKVANSPVKQIQKLKIPVLIAHGTEDKRVPFEQAELLREALEEHGKTYEWLEYEGERHGFYKEANHEDFLKRSIEFLDKHIGPNAAAKPADATQTQ